MLKLDNSYNKNNDKINNILANENFYISLSKIDNKKHYASVESALFGNSITNAFSTFLEIGELLKNENIDKRDRNVLSSYITTINAKKEIKKHFSITKDYNLKVNINYENDEKEVLDEIIKTYTNFVEKDVFYSNNNLIKNFSDLVNFSYNYFEVLEYNAKQKGIKKDIKVKFEDYMFSGLEYQIETNIEKITFDDIGGLEEAKKELKYLAKGLKNPKLYEEERIRFPKGFILYGPPGIGKTEIIKALANESGWPLKIINISNVLSKYYGESSKFLVRDLSGFGIKFLDELDTIGRARGMFTSEGSHTLVNTLNQFLNKYDPKTFFIGATNRIEDIDPAIKRAGRFDKIIKCSPPDKKGIIEIFNIHKKKAEDLSGKELFNKLNYENISEIMYGKGLVGADISEIIRRTLEKRVYDKIDGKKVNLISEKDIASEITNYERSEGDEEDKNIIIIKNGKNNNSNKPI
jgi:SpoVK/Ycf46/Vps4 family AAA+-type ATPase